MGEVQGGEEVMPGNKACRTLNLTEKMIAGIKILVKEDMYDNKSHAIRTIIHNYLEKYFISHLNTVSGLKIVTLNIYSKDLNKMNLIAGENKDYPSVSELVRDILRREIPKELELIPDKVIKIPKFQTQEEKDNKFLEENNITIIRRLEY